VSGKKGRTTRCFCNKKLRPGDTRCPRCHRVTRKGMAANIRKAVAAAAGPSFIGKSAGVKVQCPACGHENRRGGNLCTECLELMPGVRVPPVSDIGSPDAAKAAFATNFWTRRYGNDPDPAKREMVNKRRYGGLNGGAVS
jgi:hypothetical protein